MFGKKWLLSGTSGGIRAKLLYSDQVVAVGQYWLYSRKVVAFEKAVVFGKKWLYSAKWLYSGKLVVIGQSCCIRAKVVL